MIVSWIVYTDSYGQIMHITPPPSGDLPIEGSVDINGWEVSHILEADLESINFQKPEQFMDGYWKKAGVWSSKGPRLSQYYEWDPTIEDWKLNSQRVNDMIKGERYSKLGHSDWTQANDSPLTSEKKEEWAVYRQALRDITISIPADLDDPENMVWPTPPA